MINKKDIIQLIIIQRVIKMNKINIQIKNNKIIKEKEKLNFR